MFVEPPQLSSRALLKSRVKVKTHTDKVEAVIEQKCVFGAIKALDNE